MQSGGTSVAVPPNGKGTYSTFDQLSSFAGESLLHEGFFLLYQAIGFLLQGSFISGRERRGDLLFLIAYWWNRCACSTLQFYACVE